MQVEHSDAILIESGGCSTGLQPTQSSQGSSFSFLTPKPVQRAPTVPAAETAVARTTESDASRVVEHLAETLRGILADRGVEIESDSARTLVIAATVPQENGTLILDDDVLDAFYRIVEQNGMTFVNAAWICDILPHIAPQSRVALGPSQDPRSQTPISLRATVVKDAFVLLAESRLAAPNVGVQTPEPTLFPNARTLQRATLTAYQAAVQRLKNCAKVVWWSEAEALSRIAPVVQNKILIRPVECAIGVPGSQAIVGFLRRSSATAPVTKGAPTEGLMRRTSGWCLQQGEQTLALDMAQCDSGLDLFLENNIVVITGTIRDHVLYAEEIAHPPSGEFVAEGENAYGKQTPWMHKTAKSDQDGLRQKLLSLQTREGRTPSDVWLVFGNCCLDKAAAISNIYAAIQETKEVLSGIILIGDFSSTPFSYRTRADYMVGLSELFETLILCSEKLKGCRVVMIPGPNDPGPKFLPKPSLPHAFLNKPNGGLPEDVQLVLSSNPTRFYSIQEVPLGSPPDTLRGTLKTEMVIYRANLIDIISREQLAVRQPFEQPLCPSEVELEQSIPSLIAGQAHLFPVPFSSPYDVNIAPGCDKALHLYPELPQIVIVSDTVPAYTTVWEKQTTFCCPGTVENGQYIVADMCSSTVAIRTVQPTPL